MKTTPATAARKLGKAIAKLTRKTYFDRLPIMELTRLVEDHGFVSDELDGFYCGHDGRVSADIGFGRGLMLTWHKMEVSGRFEVVAYVS
jgi:hypothetical protein